ncbi:hypothetical protein D9M73_91990 [compost metagenome]
MSVTICPSPRYIAVTILVPSFMLTVSANTLPSELGAQAPCETWCVLAYSTNSRKLLTGSFAFTARKK